LLVAGSGSGGLAVLLALDHNADRLAEMGFKVVRPLDFFFFITLKPRVE